MSDIIQYPMRGVQIWKNKFGMDILRLHYSADPRKDEEWVRQERARSTSEAFFRQEYEIDFGATLGTLIYEMDDDATLEEGFDVPHEWTRYSALDPHPAVPHATLWAAVDPWGDIWIYRELWPSKVCLRYRGGVLEGAPGNVPEDDNRITIPDYVEVLQWLESEHNPENHGRREKFYDRAIDYAARSFGQGTSDDPEQPNFQQRFISAANALDYNLWFQDAKKDHDAGFELVNTLMKPRLVDDGKNGFVKKSRLRIMRDRCPELVYQIKNYRRHALTPTQAETSDPKMRVVKKRDHLCDDLRYIAMMNPQYVTPSNRANLSTFTPINDVGGY